MAPQPVGVKYVAPTLYSSLSRLAFAKAKVNHTGGRNTLLHKDLPRLKYPFRPFQAVTNREIRNDLATFKLLVPNTMGVEVRGRDFKVGMPTGILVATSAVGGDIMNFNSKNESNGMLPGVRVRRDALEQHQFELDQALSELEIRWSDWITSYSTRCAIRAGRTDYPVTESDGTTD